MNVQHCYDYATRNPTSAAAISSAGSHFAGSDLLGLFDFLFQFSTQLAFEALLLVGSLVVGRASLAVERQVDTSAAVLLMWHGGVG